MIARSTVRSKLGRRASAFGTPADQAVYDVLHLANEAAPAFREGLTRTAAVRGLQPLRELLASAALAITDVFELLAWDGEGVHHADEAMAVAAAVLGGADSQVVRLSCGPPGCRLEWASVVPLVVDDAVVGTLATYGENAEPGHARALGEVARWVSTQVELGELEKSRARAVGTQLQALRAQISPHFVGNALAAIAGFVRTDPPRARELLLEFAEYTRYSFRSNAQFTSLAEELRAVDTYLKLERARLGDRVQVHLQVAPEVLPVVIPTLVLQPLVENAVRHGLEGKPGPGRVSITATDAGTEAHLCVEDDGVGTDPVALARQLAGQGEDHHIGLANVDERLRTVFGDEYGLVIETAPGRGTKVILRIPKYRSRVRPP